MNNKIQLLSLAVLLSLAACSGEKKSKSDDLYSGLWKAELHLDTASTNLPFFLHIGQTDTGTYIAAVMNGSERIFHNEVEVQGDSIFIKSPFFNSEIRAGITRNELNGYWYDHSRPDNYRIPFSAKYNLTNRFRFDAQLRSNIGGNWKTVFSPGTEHPDTAVAVFEHGEQGVLTGTFLTTTGDYRFLEGGFDGEELKLSTFDGSHAFLFLAEMRNDTFYGTFYSGDHWEEKFIAWKDEDYKLPDAYTEISYDSTVVLNLDLPTISGEAFSLKQYADEPVLIQIMGTWCPNCLDESIFLSRNQERIDQKGVRLLTVLFERQEFEDLQVHLTKYRKNLEVQHPYLYGGRASKSVAGEVFPELSEIRSFPTTIFLDRDHRIHAVHSGYNGPGTGVHFDVQSNRFWRNIEAIATQ